MSVPEAVGPGLCEIEFPYFWVQTDSLGERLGCTFEFPLCCVDVTGKCPRSIVGSIQGRSLGAQREGLVVFSLAIQSQCRSEKLFSFGVLRLLFAVVEVD